MNVATANTQWARALVDALVQSGVREFLVAPGSRSTPLTLAAYEHPDARVTVHFDERGTAFAALGVGRASAHPAVWITTSGTAVANGMPAVVEADADGVPMVLLTADRPPRLRETGANQTIRQPDFFAGWARWSFDLPTPTPDLPPDTARSVAAFAVFKALEGRGPVHLNQPFEEPLWDPAAPMPAFAPAPKHALSRLTASAEPLVRALSGVERGFVVAGRLASRDEADAAVQLAAHLGWPLLVDVLSGLRLHPDAERILPLDLAMQTPLPLPLPEAVLQVGGMPVSKRYLQFLDARKPRVHAVLTSRPVRIDPVQGVTHSLAGWVPETVRQFVAETPARVADGWAAGWMQEVQGVESRLHERIAALPELSEAGIVHRLTTLLPDGEQVLVGASLPIREMDLFAARTPSRVDLFANRGASGIDGTVATGVGLALGGNRPVTVLLGDLTLLHDLNSLALLARAPQRMVVVVLNNDGGGIFSFLPIAQQVEAPFEPCFGTPHGLGFAHAAAQFGLAYAQPTTVDAFADAYSAALHRPGASLIEVRTHRTTTREIHAQLLG